MTPAQAFEEAISYWGDVTLLQAYREVKAWEDSPTKALPDGIIKTLHETASRDLDVSMFADAVKAEASRRGLRV